MRIPSFVYLTLFATCLQGATITFDNLNTNGDGAYGIRSAAESGAVLVTTSNGYTGIMGRFTISDSAVSSNFASGNLGAIAAGFSAFDPVTGNFALDSFGPGAFQTSESFDTKDASNDFGGSNIYAVFYNGASIATATELFVAKLNATFPTDPDVGLPLTGSASLNPTGLASILVGTTGAPNDYGLGSGPLATYQLVGVPEPSRALILGVGMFGVLMIRNRRRKPFEV